MTCMIHASTWKCVFGISKKTDPTFDSMPLRKPHTGNLKGWPDKWFYKYSKSFHKWLKHICFFRGFCSSSQGVIPNYISQFRVLYHQDLLFCVSQFSGLPLFEPRWSKSFELQGSDGCGLGVEVAFKRYGNQDVPLVTSPPEVQQFAPWKMLVGKALAIQQIPPCGAAWLTNDAQVSTLCFSSSGSRSKAYWQRDPWLLTDAVTSLHSPLIRHKNSPSTT